MRGRAKQIVKDVLWQHGNVDVTAPKPHKLTMEPYTFDYVGETNTFAKFDLNPPAEGLSTHT